MDLGGSGSELMTVWLIVHLVLWHTGGFGSAGGVVKRLCLDFRRWVMLCAEVDLIGFTVVWQAMVEG